MYRIPLRVGILSAALFGLPAQLAFADEAAPSTSLITEAAISNARTWLANPVVRVSIDSQNKKYSAIDQSTIDDLDKQWRKERKEKDQPLIAATLSSPLSNYLLQIQAASVGLYTEMFVMDAKGLNVGQSSITSDFWQGDEAKFQKTFPKGSGQIFIDEPEYHEGSKTWRAQVNMTISNNDDKPIGAVTIEYNLTELQRRHKMSKGS
ncbi:hypothetical protein [Sneathiella aquimaris]|uniref:hypothetical protein n=1 Tax=Sneathiella aquimaris TaxID=2599305 RepID=UPI001CA4D484|nr:hypothetical protein [Sneathiella aquimaris]